MSATPEPATETPWQAGDLVNVSYDAIDIPASVLGIVRKWGTYPAPWLQLLVDQRGTVVVFLGAGVFIDVIPRSPRAPASKPAKEFR